MEIDYFRDRPIQLVAIKEDGRFELTNDGIEYLNSLKHQKISVLSITGPYRSGKSFLANLIMNKMSGFRIGSTTNACTKGLWVWGRPIPLENGSSLLVIDCEGLGSVEKDRTGNIDLKIFTLSVLLSSSIIYNIMQNITDDKIEELSNAANLSMRINISKDDKNNLGLNFSDFFPELIFVVRDFYLNDEGKTPKQYLEEKLKNVDTNEIQGGESKNICRDIIKKNFKNRDCYTLVRPCNDEAKLKNLDNEKKSSLRKEFITQVDQMIDKIKNTIKPKKVKNTEIDGEIFFGLLQTYVEDINNDENPVILSALENVLLYKANNLSNSVFKKFSDEIKNQVEDKYPIKYEEIYNLFINNQNTLVEDFCKEINDTISTEQVGVYVLKLFSSMKDLLDEVIESNTKAYENYLENESNNIVNSIQGRQYEKLEETKIYFMNLSNEIQNCLNKFADLDLISDQAKKIITNISDMLKHNLFEVLRRMGNKIEDINTALENKYNSQIDDLNIQIKHLTDSLIQEKKIVELKEKEIYETNIRLAELEGRNDSMRRKIKDKEKEYSNNLNTELEKYQRMEQRYISQIQEKDDKISLLQGQMNQLNNKSTKFSQNLVIENEKLRKEIDKYKEKCLNNTTEVVDSKAINLKEMFKTFQENISDFKDDINRLEQEKNNLFKEKYLQKCKEEIESKTRNWGIDIINIIKRQVGQIGSGYEENVKKLQEENDSLNKQVERLQNEIMENQNYKSSYEGSKNEINSLMYISTSKDEIIKTHEMNIKLKEEKISELTAQNENFQEKACELVVKNREKEEELEEIFFTFEAVLSKNKNTYEKQLFNLKPEVKERFEEYHKKYKFKLK